MASLVSMLGEILQQKYGLTAHQLDEALAAQREKGGRLGEILVALGHLDEPVLAEALALQLELPSLGRVEPKDVDRDLVQRVPIAFARRYRLLPLRRDGGRVLVACADPLDCAPLDDLRLIFQADVRPVVAPAATIEHAINLLYERPIEGDEQVIDDLSDVNLDQLASELEEPQDLLEATEEAPVIKFVNSVLYRAVKSRASDIHVEPFEREVAVRYRIDGILYTILSPPRRVYPSLISRIKIMAGLDIAEKRLPQDGRIGVKMAGRDIDIRVSIIPTAHGERAVLRLLDKGTLLHDLTDLGLSPDRLRTVESLITLSHGIFLVTGPTGSGKTTTLYAALNRINLPDKNIITIEDPVEYKITGIGQMQVSPKIDLTFANGLRSILRQDPDVIMVGEIRDVETAEIAIHASLTGHLVFSTLHTNDAAGAITRLLDMGIEPFLVSSSVVAIMAQRLVRVLCRHCRQPYTPEPQELQKLGLASGEAGPFYRARGCPDCMQTGYSGRQGIYEILLVDDEIRRLILSKMDAASIRTLAIERKGMTTLKADGSAKIRAGVTTTEEVLRVTQQEVV